MTMLRDPYYPALAIPLQIGVIAIILIWNYLIIRLNLFKDDIVGVSIRQCICIDKLINFFITPTSNPFVGR